MEEALHGGSGPTQWPLTSPHPTLSRLQEAQKQSQGLQQELAALREELAARGPGGRCSLACLSLSKAPT